MNRLHPGLSQISPQTRWSRPQSRWIPFHYRETLTTAKVRRAEEPSALDYAAQQLKEDQIGQVRELLKRGDTGQRPELSLPVLDSRQRQAVRCEVTTCLLQACMQHTSYLIMCCAQYVFCCFRYSCRFVLASPCSSTHHDREGWHLCAG